VLRAAGRLVVGLYVESGESGESVESGHVTFTERAKELIRHWLPLVGVTRYMDHHVWHPTYAELRKLIGAAGFTVRNVHWQRGASGVCYIEALK
jgi:hypothetical protein